MKKRLSENQKANNLTRVFVAGYARLQNAAPLVCKWVIIVDRQFFLDGSVDV